MRKIYPKKFMMLLFLLLVTAGLSTGCSKGDEVTNEEEANAVVATGLDLVFLNEDGEDLLNPSTKNHLSRDKMALYYLVDGKKVVASEFDPDIGRHQGIMLIDETEPYSLRIFTARNLKDVNSEKEGEKRGTSISYLELGNGITDTIKTEWKAKTGLFVNLKVWYNGEELENREKAIIIH
ncbi:hypothetical protein [Salegentibacter sediminis]|uniref:hypothetical protein n=2 Tax=Salegentibacter TaxID=143222 RepID=UPI0009BE37B0|nr:hypothetical protein [Salegentibacter sediminis]